MIKLIITFSLIPINIFLLVFDTFTIIDNDSKENILDVSWFFGIVSGIVSLTLSFVMSPMLKSSKLNINFYLLIQFIIFTILIMLFLFLLFFNHNYGYYKNNNKILSKS